MRLPLLSYDPGHFKLLIIDLIDRRVQMYDSIPSVVTIQKDSIASIKLIIRHFPEKLIYSTTLFKSLNLYIFLCS